MTFKFDDDSAVQRNKDLMREFECALQTDPAVDLMSLIPQFYHPQHKMAELRSLESAAAKLNRRTMNALQTTLRRDPEVEGVTDLPRRKETIIGNGPVGL